MAGQASHAVFEFGSRSRVAMRVLAALWRDRAYRPISISPPLCQDRSSLWNAAFGLARRRTGDRFFFIVCASSSLGRPGRTRMLVLGNLAVSLADATRDAYIQQVGRPQNRNRSSSTLTLSAIQTPLYCPSNCLASPPPTKANFSATTRSFKR